MPSVVLAAVAAILVVSAVMVIAVVIAERGRTSQERAKADRLEIILRETIQSSLTNDELDARQRRTYVLGLYDAAATAPYVNAGF